ncbi:MAG: pentapeptide repeat-containing protein [Myxococcota bacterium]|nr:pentapeptide repeat-containing protein [Myxococcota bacterium]
MRPALESLLDLLTAEDSALQAQGLSLLSALSLTPSEAAHILTARPWCGRALGALPLSGARLADCQLAEIGLTGSDLSHAHLQRARLTDLDLSAADLTGADLTSATLRQCVFWTADLTGADLRGAVLCRVSFANAEMASINLCGARLQSCRLVGLSLSGLKGGGLRLVDTALRQCDLTGADLRQLHATPGCDLRESRLVRACLSGADLRGCALSGADLSGADLSGADLSGADLRDAVLTGATLTGATLTAADLRGAVLPAGLPLDQCLCDETLRPGASLRRWRLEHRALRDVDLTGADLTGADLTGADLTGADLTDAKLCAASLNEATLRDADLRGADLTDADLRGADLRGADLRRAQRWRVDARWALVDDDTVGEAGLIGVRRLEPGADLRGWHARSLDLSGVDLSGADLRGAWLSDVALRHANLTGMVRPRRWEAALRLLDVDMRGAALTPSEGSGECVDIQQPGGHSAPDLLTLHTASADWSEGLRGDGGGPYDLRQASLVGMALSDADLQGACLQGADLTDADLTGADLTDADLTGAFLDGCAWDATTRWPRQAPPPVRPLPRLRGAPWAGHVSATEWLADACWIPLWDGAPALRWAGNRWHRIRLRQCPAAQPEGLTDRDAADDAAVVVDLDHPEGWTGALVQLLVALGCARHDLARRLLLHAAVCRAAGGAWELRVPGDGHLRIPGLLSCALAGVEDARPALAGLWRHFVMQTESGKPPRFVAASTHASTTRSGRTAPHTTDHARFTDRFLRLRALETFGVTLPED